MNRAINILIRLALLVAANAVIGLVCHWAQSAEQCDGPCACKQEGFAVPLKPVAFTQPAPTPRPILFLLTADWCQFCPKQKAILDGMTGGGRAFVDPELYGTIVVQVTKEKHRATYEAVTGGVDPPLPCLVMYSYLPGRTAVGVQSAAQVKALLRGEAQPQKPKEPLPIPPDISDLADALMPLEGLLTAGKKFSGALVVQSPPHPVLMETAQKHADYQARAQQQGHQLWSQRKYEIQALVGGDVEEVCAESWPPQWQKDPSPEGIGREMFDSWRQSPGHWAVVSRLHRAYGAGIAKAANGICFSAIHVAD